MTPTKPCDIHFVSWNRPKITELAIRTIVRNTKPYSYRLVVLDNGSDDSQQQMLRNLQDNGLIDELILWPTNEGLETARNYMLAHCTQSKYFICADNDCLPQPIESMSELIEETDWVEKLINLMERYQDYAAISCRTQVMIGSGNIFEDETQEITEFPHPGGSLRIMVTGVTQAVGGWDGNPGRGAEERNICGKLHDVGFKTGFATHIKTLHLFGLKDTDRWGYPIDWRPESTGHSDISHPALEQGDDLEEVKKYAGEALTNGYNSHTG